jgi:phosphoenolpyruvate carboxykinase (diphosphate)
VTHWSGHTGCVILAPHLTGLLKKDVGLPHWDDASERQRRDGMCWQNEDERYNDGGAFKIVCRDMDGVIVTLIADNYFGYSKKEIKSQISYAANLFGGSEEEHSGGALAFPSFNLGDSYSLDSRYLADGHTMQDMMRLYADDIDFRPEGHGIDKAIRKSSMCRKTPTWTCSNSRPTGPGATNCAS